MPKSKGEHTADEVDDLFDEDKAPGIERPEWDQGGQVFADKTPRVKRQRFWYDGGGSVVGRDPSDPMDWRGRNAGPVMGLAVPGLFAAKRDNALKESAGKLLNSGYRQLVREVFRLAPMIPKNQKVRPGFKSIAPKLLATWKQFFAWYQDLTAMTSGEIPEVKAVQLAEFRARYDGFRTQVDNVLANRGERTSAPPGPHLFDPPRKTESWAEWLRRFPTGAGLGFGALLALAALLWISKKG